MKNTILDKIIATLFSKNTLTRAGDCVPGRSVNRFLTSTALAAALLLGAGTLYAQTDYTVDPTLPTAGTNYATLEELREANIIWFGNETILLKVDGTDATLTDEFDFGGQSIHIHGYGFFTPQTGVDTRLAYHVGAGPRLYIQAAHNRTLTFDGFSVTGTGETSRGGAIFGSEFIFGDNGAGGIIGSLVFSNNSATATGSDNQSGQGGAIYATQELDFYAGEYTFSQNNATGSGAFSALGGAIYAKAALQFDDGTYTFSQNEANGGAGTDSGQGGAIYAFDTLNFTHGEYTFSQNEAIGTAIRSGWGGAIYAAKALTFTDGTYTFSQNKTTGGTAVVSGYGGAIYANAALQFDDGTYTFSQNSTTGNANESGWGGAIYAAQALTFTDGTYTFSQNSASGSTSGSGWGGAIYAAKALTFTDGTYTFSLNSATGGTDSSSGQGGAIFAYQNDLKFGAGTYTFSRNSATGGTGANSGRGGAIFAYLNDLEFGAGTYTFSQNSASGSTSGSGWGGAIFVHFSELKFDDGTYTFSQNSANGGTGNISGQGGAIHARAALTFTDGDYTFSQNEANGGTGANSGQGGAIYANAELKFTGGDYAFTDNSATGTGTDSGLGGAIFARNNATLIADKGNILFRGNTQGTADTRKANAVFMFNNGGNKTLNLAATTGQKIEFFDPIDSNADNPDLTIEINNGGAYTGTVVFDGSYWRNKTADDYTFSDGDVTTTVYGTTTVHGGTLALKNGVTYHSAGTGYSFTLDTNATLLSNAAHTNTVQAATITLNAASTLAFDMTGATGTTTNLVLSGTAVTPSSGTVDLRGIADLAPGTYNLVTAPGIGAGQALTIYGEAIAGTRAAVAFELDVDVPGNTLQLTKKDNYVNYLTHWTNTSNNGQWDTGSGNWDHTGSDPNATDTFFHGDAVVFGAPGYSGGGAITIHPGGVELGTLGGAHPGMEIAGGDWTFTGGEILGGDAIHFSGNGSATFEGVNGGAGRDMHQRITSADSKTTTLIAADGTTLYFDGFHTESNGGAISGDNDLNLGIVGGTGKMVFSQNSTTGTGTASSVGVGLGGAIYATNLTFTDGDYSFTDNSATGDSYSSGQGGAIFAYGTTTFTAGDYSFANNSATGGTDSASGWGGAIVTGFGLTFTAGDYSFTDNSATGGTGTSSGRGGAIIADVTLNFIDGDYTFTDNSATGDSDLSGWGGAIYANGITTFTAGDYSFTDNSASGGTGSSSGQGGVIYADGTLNFIGGEYAFTDNSATGGTGTSSGWGGAIFAANTLDFTAGDYRFTDNSASGSGTDSGWGGAIYVARTLRFTAGDYTFSNNSATGGSGDLSGLGGAIYAKSTVTFATGDYTFTNNSATGTGERSGQGGAIFAEYNATLIADGGDILFRGNTQGTETERKANAIFMDNNLGFTLNLAAKAGQKIEFFDPIDSHATRPDLTIDINKPNTIDGGGVYDGTVVFDGSHWTEEADRTSMVYGNTTVHAGTLALRNGVTYGAASDVGNFMLFGGVTLQVSGATNTIRAEAVTLTPGSTLAFDLIGADPAVALLDVDAVNYTSKIGTQIVNVTDTGGLADSNSYLLATAAAGSVDTSGDLFYNTVLQATPTRGGGTVKALTTDVDSKNLYVQNVTLAATGNTLLWNGESDTDDWNTEASNKNWYPLFGDNFITTGINYVDGEHVVFTDYGGSKTVNVDTNGVAPASVTIDADDDYTIGGGPIGGSGALSKTGTGTLTLTGANTYGGGTTVSDGKLIGDTTSLQGDIVNNAVLQFNQAEEGSYAENLTGTGTFIKESSGLLVISEDATQNAFNLNAGALTVASDKTLTGNFASLAGTTLNVSEATITGTGSLAAGTMIVANLDGLTAGTDTALAFNGALTIGALPTDTININVTNTTPLAAGTYTIVHAGGFDFTDRYVGTVNGKDVGMNGPNIRYGGIIFDSATVGKLDLTVADDDQKRTATWTNFSNDGLWNETSKNWSLTDSTLEVFKNGDDVEFRDMSGSETVTVAEGMIAGSMIVDSASDYTFTGGSIKADSFIKNNTGTVTFEKANDFGSAALLGGITNLEDAGALGTSTVTINTDTTLGLADTLVLANDIDFSGDGNIAVASGAASLSGAFSGTGTLSKTGTGKLTLLNDVDFGGSITVSDGILTLSSGKSVSVNDFTVSPGKMLETAVGNTIMTTGTLNFGVGSHLALDMTGATETDPVLTFAADTLDFGIGYPVTVNVTGTAGLAGTYTIIDTGTTTYDFDGKYIGSVNGQSDGFKGPNTRYGGVDYDHETLGKLILHLAADDQARQATWTGANGNTWNETDENWNLDDSDLHVFKLGDSVVFTENGAGGVFVTAGMSVSTMEITGGSYVFNGNAITSTGAFTKNGNGRVDFNVANHFASAVLNAGAVVLYHADGLGNGSVTINDNTQILLNDGIDFKNAVTLNDGAFLTHGSDQATVSGIISGGGKLSKFDTGTLTLTGANTYTGGTLVGAGKLIGDTNSIRGDIENNAELSFVQNNEAALDGTLTGTGTFEKTGMLNLTFSDNVTQDSVILGEGTLTLAAGKSVTTTGLFDVGDDTVLVLSIGASPAVEAGSVAIGTGATLTINGYNDNYPQTPITVVKSGSVITGSFATVDAAGQTIVPDTPDIDVFLDIQLDQAAAGGKEIQITTDLVWNKSANAHGTFNITEGNAFTISTDLADNTKPGAGDTFAWDGKTLTKKGAGTLVLSGDNSYDGSTLIETGKLVAGTETALGGSTVRNDAALELAFDGVFGNDLYGTGTLIIGTDITMTGDQSGFRGTVDITRQTTTLGTKGGLSFVSGAEYIVGNTSFLQGEGTIGSLTVLNGGTFKPGFSPGTITTRTTAVFQTGSIYEVEVAADGSANDKLVVGTTATVENGAILDVIVDGKMAFNTTREYLIIETGSGIDNTFSVVPDKVGYKFDQKIATNNLYLAVTATRPEFAKLIDGIGTPNAVRAAYGLDAVVEAGEEAAVRDLFDALSNLADDAKIVANAFAQLHGEMYATNAENAARMQRSFNERLARLGRERDVSASCNPCGAVNEWKRTLWGTFTGDTLNRGGIGRYSGLDLNTYGVAVGVEQQLNRRWFLGAAFGYDNATAKYDSFAARDESDVFRASVYGGFNGKRWHGTGYVGYGKNWHDTSRNIGFGNYSSTSKGKYDDEMISSGFELGRVVRVGKGRLAPSFGLDYVHVSSPGFTERGGNGTNLVVSPDNYDSLRLPVGARWNRDFTTPLNRGLWNRITWTPEVRAYYVPELLDRSVSVQTGFAGTSPRFAAESGEWGRHSGRFGIGLGAALSERLSVRLDYDYEIWQHVDMHHVGGNMTYRW